MSKMKLSKNKSKTNCAFCFTTFVPTTRLSETINKNVIYDGVDLEITLDNPVKNREAFRMLCKLLKIDWQEEDHNETATVTFFEGNYSLPLCTKCQTVYQEMYQLHVQMKDLEKLLHGRAQLVKKLITLSFNNVQKPTITLAEPLARLTTSEGVHRFRSKVFQENNKSEEDVKKQKCQLAKAESSLETEGKKSVVTEVEVWNSEHSPSFIPKVEFLEFDLSPDENYDATKHSEISPPDSEDVMDAELQSEGEIEASEEPQDDSKSEVSDADSEEYRPRKSVRKQKTTKAKSESSKKPGSSRKNRSGIRSKTNFTCHICDKVVTGLTNFHLHYAEEHPEEKKYTCKYCQHYFKTLYDVSNHQRSHTKEKPFECHYCLATFSTKKSMKSHIKCYHEKPPSIELFACDQCDKSFVSKTRLDKHLEVHSTLIILCKTCGVSVKSKNAFHKHNKNSHDGKAECTIPVSLEENVTRTLNVDASACGSNLKCHVCWSFIPGRKGAKLHFKVYHPELNPNQCTTCSKIFSTYSDCRKHALRHTSDMKPLQCEQCPMRFFTSTELKIHTETHVPTEERTKYTCDICGSTFASRPNFAYHLRKHKKGNSGELVYCELCGKSYSDRKGYTQHKNTVHAVNRPHKCPHCPWAGGRYSDLTKHVRRHTKQKPFKCPLCEKRFPYSSSRARHVRQVHGRQGVTTDLELS